MQVEICADGHHPLYVAFVWHQHQPLYKDPLKKTFVMPWVRLHAVKDYLDMVAILRLYPRLHQTFNLVPSLLDQIDDYLESGSTDPYLSLTQKRAEDLSISDRRFLLARFFDAHEEQMINPHARYVELLESRRFWGIDKAAGEWSNQDFRDLQAWFNLSWMDPDWRSSDPRLRDLVNKGRGYSEEDLARLIAVQYEIMRAIIPEHKALAQVSQVELTTSPYFHPILPLLRDTDSARVASPGLPLPTRFRHPEDAMWQILKGLDAFEMRFGMRPLGMWPSENAVATELVPAFADAGIRWIISDEEILAQSIKRPIYRDTRGVVQTPELLYQPYRVEYAGHTVQMVFRDHHLSDLIGFVYSRQEPEDASLDLITRLHRIREDASAIGRPLLVTIALDGENAWESYPDDGKPFFHHLYRAFSVDPLLRTVTVSEYLDLFPPRETLKYLHTGSWINHDLETWIGEDEENLAWDYLGSTRDFLEEFSASNPKHPQLEEAWDELFAAEGSDWFWWYGDDQCSGIDELYDELFRRHLINVYLTIGAVPPEYLHCPIISCVPATPAREPSGDLAVVIDGRPTFTGEWDLAGYRNDVESGGAMATSTTDLIRHIYYGKNDDLLYFRIDSIGSLLNGAENLAFLIYLTVGRETPSRTSRFRFSDGSEFDLGMTAEFEAGLWLRRGQVHGTLRQLRDGDDPQDRSLSDCAVVEFVEVAIPRTELGLDGQDGLWFRVVASLDGKLMDVAPNDGPIFLQLKGTE